MCGPMEHHTLQSPRKVIKSFKSKTTKLEFPGEFRVQEFRPKTSSMEGVWNNAMAQKFTSKYILAVLFYLIHCSVNFLVYKHSWQLEKVAITTC